MELKFVEALKNQNTREVRVVFRPIIDDDDGPYFVVKIFDPEDPDKYSVKYYPSFARHTYVKSFWRTVLVLVGGEETEALAKALKCFNEAFEYMIMFSKT